MIHLSRLARCPLFQDMPLRALADLSQVLIEGRLEAGAPLFEPGDPAETLYLVTEGELELLDRQGRSLGRVGPDAFIGEAAALLPSTHTIRCVASRSTRLLALSHGEIDALWERLPPVAALVEMAIASWIMRDLEAANLALLDQCDFTLGEVAHPGLREMLNRGTFKAD